MSFKMVEKPEYITKETIQLAHALGWCTELVSIVNYIYLYKITLYMSTFEEGKELDWIVFTECYIS